MTAGVGRTSIACQCASMRPGMSVRPPPSMIFAEALPSIEIGSLEMMSIVLPRIENVRVLAQRVALAVEDANVLKQRESGRLGSVRDRCHVARRMQDSRNSQSSAMHWILLWSSPAAPNLSGTLPPKLSGPLSDTPPSG